MLGINGKQWNDIQWTDVEEFLNEIEESFFFEFKKDEAHAVYAEGILRHIIEV